METSLTPDKWVKKDRYYIESSGYRVSFARSNGEDRYTAWCLAEKGYIGIFASAQEAMRACREHHAALPTSR